MSARETVEAKAGRLLVSGRVWIERVEADLVAARVMGDTGAHDVVWSAEDGWWCSCPASVQRCSHVLAVELVADPDPEPGPSDPDPEPRPRGGEHADIPRENSEDFSQPPPGLGAACGSCGGPVAAEGLTARRGRPRRYCVACVPSGAPMRVWRAAKRRADARAAA